MITILEGPDGAGKTTLAKSAFADHHYVHLGPPSPEGALNDCVAAISANYNQDRVLFDRFHLGERIYGPVFRDRDGLGAVGQKSLERMLLQRPAVMVLCLPPFLTCLESYRARRATEMLTNETQLAQVYARYQIIRSDLPVIVYDFTIETPARLRDRVEAARSSGEST